MVTIKRADILQRKTGSDNYGFIGLIYSENNSSTLDEGSAYLLDFSANPPVLYSDEILPKPYGYEGCSIDNILNKEVWCATHKAGFSIVRVIPDGLQDGGLIIYGANTEPLIEDPLEDIKLVFREGTLFTQKPDINATRGLKLGQVLKYSGLFHNEENERLYLSNLTTPAQITLREIQTKRFDLANNVISANEYKTWINENESRRSFGAEADTNSEFLIYLKELSKLNELGLGIGTMTEKERIKLDRSSKEAMQKVLNLKISNFDF